MNAPLVVRVSEWKVRRGQYIYREQLLALLEVFSAPASYPLSSADSSPSFDSSVSPTLSSASSASNPILVSLTESSETRRDAVNPGKRSSLSIPRVVRLESTHEGIVHELDVKEGDIIRPGQNLGVIRVCPHEVHFSNMCVMCGQNIKRVEHYTHSAATKPDIVTNLSEPMLTISGTRAQSNQDQLRKQLLGSRKLCLMLDIDRTLLQATNDQAMEPLLGSGTSAAFRQACAELGSSERHSDSPPLPLEEYDQVCRFLLNREWYYVKLRPHLRAFLEEVSKLFQLSIYTQGTRPYANNIAQIVDPTKALFANRIVSREQAGEENTRHLKGLKKIFPFDESMVLVLDDRADVWREDTSNILKVHPYTFFSTTVAELNYLGGTPSSSSSTTTTTTTTTGTASPLTETSEAPPQSTATIASAAVESSVPLTAHQSTEEEEADSEQEEQEDVNGKQLIGEQALPEGTKFEENTASLLSLCTGSSFFDSHLPSMLSVLQYVHGEFFKQLDQGNPSPNVKHLLAQRRRQVLSGTVISFTGVIPSQAIPQQSRIWLLASAFGARCVTELDGSVTHLVATQLYTSKAKEAIRSERPPYIVRPLWLLSSVEHWRKQDEDEYLVTEAVASMAGLTREEQEVERDCFGFVLWNRVDGAVPPVKRKLGSVMDRSSASSSSALQDTTGSPADPSCLQQQPLHKRKRPNVNQSRLALATTSPSSTLRNFSSPSSSSGTALERSSSSVHLSSLPVRSSSYRSSSSSSSLALVSSMERAARNAGSDDTDPPFVYADAHPGVLDEQEPEPGDQDDEQSRSGDESSDSGDSDSSDQEMMDEFEMDLLSDMR